MSCPRWFILVILLLISAVACGNKEHLDRNSSEKVGHAKDIESQIRTTRVFSSTTPNQIGEIDFEKLKMVLYRPGYPIFDEAGALYVVDFSGFKIHKFVPDHAWKSFEHTSFGKGVGQGPGEFSRVLDIKIFKDEIYLADEGTGSVEVYSTGGEYKRRIILSNNMLPRQITVQEGRLIVASMNPEDPLFFVYTLSGEMMHSFGERFDKTNNLIYQSAAVSRSFSDNRFYLLPRFTGIVGLYQDRTLIMAKETIDGIEVGKKNIPVDKSVMKGIRVKTVDKKYETVLMHAIHDEYIFIKTYDYEKKSTFWDIYSLDDFEYIMSVTNPPVSREIAIFDDYLAVLLETEEGYTIRIFELKGILEEMKTRVRQQ